MKNESANYCPWRRKLIGSGAAAWGVSLLADGAAYVEWAPVGSNAVAFYSIVVGMLLMVAAVFVCGFDLQFQREARAGNAELLDGGVILVALLLFSLNLILRLHSPGSSLPLLLSLIGFAAVLAELYLDGGEPEAPLDPAGQRTIKV